MKAIGLFQCNECGRKFKTVRSAEKAQLNGCPQCSGCDIGESDDYLITARGIYRTPAENLHYCSES